MTNIAVTVVLVLSRLVCGEQRGVDGLHAAGAREAAHQPVGDALRVVGVHARQVANAVANLELNHANHAPGNTDSKDKMTFPFTNLFALSHSLFFFEPS